MVHVANSRPAKRPAREVTRQLTRPRAEPLDLFAITAPGLEPLAAAELRALGLDPADAEAGGVAFRGGPEAVYRANLWLRTASRVVARVGEFHARMFSELERQAKRQPWERFLQKNRPVALRVTCRKSRLYHSDAVAQRVAGVIESMVSGVSLAEPPAAGEDEEGGAAQLVLVRLLHDQCTISVDTSGALLHQRGYRLATAKAPMREALAAATLMASGWRTDAPLLDPMCGAGTIAIEGAMMARRMAPGLARDFAFRHWPGFDAALWARQLDEARAMVLPDAPAPIQGSDRDAGAIDAARANAERAGVTGDIELTRRALSAIEPPEAAGWLVTNPPYGARMGDKSALRDLYAQLGNVARRKCAGWTLAMLSADAPLERQVGVPLAPVLRTRNGGIPVRIMRGVVPGP